MTQQHRPSRTRVPQHHSFRGHAELSRAVARMIPIPKTLAISDARLLQAYRAILIEGIGTQASVLGWPEGVLTTGPLPPPPTQRGRPVGRSLGGSTPQHISVVCPTEEIMYTALAVGTTPSHVFAPKLAEHVHHLTTCALHAAAALHGARTGSGSTEVGYELLASALRESIIASMLRELIEQPLTPLAAFMLGHRPFTTHAVASTTVLRWLQSVAAKTYEGQALRTGVVIESMPGSLRRHKGIRITRFDHPVPFDQHALSGQTIALADGVSSFLLLRPDLMITGVVSLLRSPNNRSTTRPLIDEPALPLNAILIQIRGPHLLRLLGLSGQHMLEVGHIRQGSFTLYDQRSLEDTIVNTIDDVATHGHITGVRALSRHLLDRAIDGLGAGVVIGTSKSFGGRRLKRPIEIDVDSAWAPFLNPDGAVLIDESLHLHEYGAMLPQPQPKLLQDRGTRHNALAAASKMPHCVAIAVSDDGTLAAFKGGKCVLSAL